MTRLIRFFIVAGILSMCAADRVAAQATQELLVALRSLQHQVDVFQADKNATIGDTRLRIWIDDATSAGFSGWGFRCGETSLRTPTGPRPATLDVLIDGVPSGAVYFVTTGRQDVRDIFASYCAADGGVPIDPGIIGLLNLSAYSVGDHTIQLRLTDTRGAVEKSNIVTVTRFPS